MAFFTNTLVGNFNGTQMRGTLDGVVTRNNNSVSLFNLTLSLSTLVNVSGTKNFTFTLNGVANTIYLNITTPKKDLGTYSLSNVNFTVQSGEWQKQIPWYTSDNQGGSFVVTFPVAPTKPTVVSAGTGFRTISVTYGTTSFGAPSTGVVRLYGGTDPNSGPLLDTYANTGTKTFTLADVLSNTTYYFRAVADNSQKLTNSDRLDVTSQKDPKFLGSARGKAVRIKKMYCSKDGKTANMKFYGSVSGVTKRIF